ncbi:LPXTG cell wall anchor domain-containing protein [Exiguobacterium sp. SH5S13]|uniref:LPXTG cell wall anchor domain-containing protein n=1 Tax=Exiguobacterium sp. SH5S13 TaxID=2510959 RepID=UPI00103E3A59|nr:LPXTG cell wall anchor domain-containing protein [Exiguobacterium sp. SH5S13]TCI56788.1 LPXTG cell wall anchor domain-containing protein [Exiguobacterium sp. SH5S13]
MRSATKRFTAFITLFVLLIGMWAPNVLYASDTTETSMLYVQVDLTAEEQATLDEASLVYADITYYGVRETADVWRFIVDVQAVETSLIDQVTLYNEEGVPYSFTPASITAELPIEELPIEEPALEVTESGVTDESSEPVSEVAEPGVTAESSESVDEETEPATEAPMIEEVAATTVEPAVAIGLEVGKEANIDQAVVGGSIPYTFVIENTGDATLTITSIEDEFFSGGIQDDAITAFNEEVRSKLTALIGDDGLASGERVETTVILDVPSDYDQVMHPEVGNIFRVAATDESGRVVNAESQQIVLLNRLDFTVTKVANPQTVHPGETILYTYTLTNTSNVTLYFVDVVEEWTSGALTAKEQRETTEVLRDGMRALAEVENGLIPGEEVVLELEKVLLPSYDVRAGGILTNRVTFTFEVNEAARVSRAAETTVHVKQAIPEREDEEAYVPEPTTPVSPEQGTLPMTGTTETWATVIGLVLIVLGLLFFTHRRRPSSKT